MGKIDYKRIYKENQDDWKALTREPQKYEALLAGHYSDSNHFVYELLQNAEDERASKVVIEYYEDKLVFYHNGDPFDEGDVRGVSSMLMGTKDRNSGQTIGRFGMGFKSVFKYTYQPEIYSDSEAFRIENYLLPVEIEDGWNDFVERQKVVCVANGDRIFKPFEGEQHLTKIIIPFAKRNNKGQLMPVSGKDVLEKLQGLNGEILLFLTHIRELYWTDKSTDKYARISMRENMDDENLVICSIEGSAYGEKENISKYLRYKKIFDHSEMSDAEVSVAYKLNNRGDNINEMKNTDIWVYFPTRDNTELPFLIHGSFETAVSREKLMSPSDFNSELFDKLGDLIAESIQNLKKRNLITQVFIRKTLMQAFQDEDENETIPGLRDKVNEAFLTYPLLPDKYGHYTYVGALRVPVPFRIAEFTDKSLFKGAFSEALRFVAFNNEKESNFTEYFLWLTDDLGVERYSLLDLANDLENIEVKQIGNSGTNYDNLILFYHFCADYMESVYATGLNYSRSGPYEKAIRACLSKAWSKLRYAPIILNAEGTLVPAYSEGREMVYLGSSSKYKSVLSSAIVHRTVASELQPLLRDGFQISEFNNFQYVKEKILRKYVVEEGEDLAYETDDYTKEYIEDITQLLQLVEDASGEEALNEIREMVKDAFIIKVIDPEYDELFSAPEYAYVDISDEGIDQTIYYAPIILYKGESYDFCAYRVDEEFYHSNGISLKNLKKLGLITSPFIPGPTKHEGRGQDYWLVPNTSSYQFYPQADIDDYSSNIEYIVRNKDDELAKRKSRELLRLLLYHAHSFYGMIYRYKDFRVQREEYANFLKQADSQIMNAHWLYGNDGELHKITELSKYDLSTEVYGAVKEDDEAYRILRFKITEQDQTASAFKQVEILGRRDKMILLKQLARELGKSISDDVSKEEWNEDENSTFDPNAWLDDGFPVHRVKNFDSLIQHVREQFFCANPIQYREVWRSIRISKSPKTVRAYAVGMYTNDSQVKLCQMCKKPADFVDAVEIANFGMELPQNYLCLCRNCSSRYKQFRDSDKESFKQKMKTALLGLDIQEEEDNYEIILNQDASLYFTQTHIAEIQTLLRLIDEYGLPNESDVTDEGLDTVLSGPLHHPMRRMVKENTEQYSSIHEDKVISDGNYITYRKIQNGESVDTTIQAGKYPLHKLMVGKKVGDVVELYGKKYEITNIL